MAYAAASAVFAAVLAVVFVVAFAAVFAIINAAVFVIISAAVFAIIGVVKPVVSSFLRETASACGEAFAPVQRWVVRGISQ